MEIRLARSVNDRMLSGVCGGLARYFGIDATIVRLVFVLAVLSGLSPLIYVILWIVMPQEGPALPAPAAPVAQAPEAQPVARGADPTGEWQFDPYTGQRIVK